MFYFLVESRLPLCSYIVMPNVHKIVSLAWPMKLYEHYMTETSIRQTPWPVHLNLIEGVCVQNLHCTSTALHKICTTWMMIKNKNSGRRRQYMSSNFFKNHCFLT